MGCRSRRSCIDVERLESRTLFSSSYNIVDLGVQAGASLNNDVQLGALAAAGLNNRGEVLVRGATMSSSLVYQDGQLTPMSTYSPKLAKHRQALPLFIDDAGDIVGTFYAGHTTRAALPGMHSGFTELPMTDVFLFDGKHFKDIGIGTPLGVAGSGVVAGTTNELFPSFGWEGSDKGFLYFHGRRKTFAPWPVPVNAHGDCLLGNAIYVAATRKTTTLSQDDSLEGALINDSDQVVGQDSLTLKWFVVSSTGQITQLGTLGLYSAAVAMNDSGAIVGTAHTSSGSSPFLDANGSMEDLNSLAPPSETGWTLTGVTSINNSGQILASGVSAPGGATHQLLLLPTG